MHRSETFSTDLSTVFNCLVVLFLKKKYVCVCTYMPVCHIYGGQKKAWIPMEHRAYILGTEFRSSAASTQPVSHFFSYDCSSF